MQQKMNPMRVLEYKYPTYLSNEPIIGRPSARILVNENDQFFFPLVRDSGTYNEDEANVMRCCIGPADTVLDIGSNAGYHTLCMAELAIEGTVVAFEAQRLIHQQLCANLALNGVFNVDALHAAVGPTNGLIKVPSTDPYTPGQNSGGMTIDRPDDAEGDTVPMVAIDHVGLPRFQFAKIDVEGSEPGVLHGMEQSLREYRPVVYMEFDRNQDEIAEFMIEAGYNIWYTEPRHARYYPKDHEWHLLVAQMLICLPAERVGCVAPPLWDTLMEAAQPGYALKDTPFGGIRAFRPAKNLTGK